MDYRSVNKVILFGNLGKDADLVHTANNFAICNFSIATTERIFKKDSGEKEDRTEWHRCVLLGKSAEALHPYLKKGTKIYVEGKLQTREWQDKDSNRRFSTEIRVLQVVFGGRSGGSQEQGSKDYSDYEKYDGEQKPKDENLPSAPANEEVAPDAGMPDIPQNDDDLPF